MFFYRSHRSVLSHYFRNLYNIIKYIDDFDENNSLFDNEEKLIEFKKKYIRIIRAQISAYELIILWYNGLQEFGEKFDKIMVKYEFLENIDAGAELVEQDELVKQHPYLKKIYDNF